RCRCSSRRSLGVDLEEVRGAAPKDEAGRTEDLDGAVPEADVHLLVAALADPEGDGRVLVQAEGLLRVRVHDDARGAVGTAAGLVALLAELLDGAPELGELALRPLRQAGVAGVVGGHAAGSSWHRQVHAGYGHFSRWLLVRQ